jgi:HEAT repeat protein
MSAWWLRRRTFAIGALISRMRTTLATDTDPVRRSRAAAALGEFLDPHALDPLTVAASSDASPLVRASAVRALGRLNHPASHGVVAAALEDPDVDVRRAVLDVALRMNFFHEAMALIGALDDTDAEIRMRAARILGEHRVDAAAPALSAMVAGDVSRDVRQAAAWSLGRIGGSEADAALTAALQAEQDSLVRDAIRVAMAM